MRSNIVIGVALSAGGAAAMAQVGVLEELSAAGLPIRCVAGTSAGAIVGAAFAAKRLEPFRELMCGLSRRRVLWLFDPTWPRVGLFEGRRAMELIRPYVGTRFETLPRRYAAVATDLRAGTEVILREGDVLEAIRASVAIPGVFTPQRKDGRLLVDGGLVDPLPVAALGELGANFTIAINVLPLTERARQRAAREARERRRLPRQLLARFLAGLARGRQARAGGAEPRQVPAAHGVGAELGLIEVLFEASRVVESQLAASRLREHPPDVLISVPLPRIGLFDFHRSQEMVDAGRAAARRALPELRTRLAGTVPIYHRVRRWLDRAASGA
jgi:NTE family protein